MAETSATSTRAHTMPGGGGKDPWDIAMQYAQQLANRTNQNNADETRIALAEYGARERGERQQAGFAQQNARDERKPGLAYETAKQRGRGIVDSGIYEHKQGVKGQGRGVSNPKNIEAFSDGVRTAGMTNPYAIAAMQAHATHESAGRPWIVNPDDNGGPSGGMLQWHDDQRKGLTRFTDMQRYAQSKGKNWKEDPGIQGEYAVQEYKSKYPKQYAMLANAKSVEEAHEAMRQIQGYKDVGGRESADRLATARSVYGKITGTPTTRGRGNVQEAAVVDGKKPDEGGWYTGEDGRKFQIFYPKQPVLDELKRQFKGTYASKVVPDPYGPKKGGSQIPYRLYKDENPEAGTQQVPLNPTANKPVQTASIAPIQEPPVEASPAQQAMPVPPAKPDDIMSPLMSNPTDDDDDENSPGVDGY